MGKITFIFRNSSFLTNNKKDLNGQYEILKHLTRFVLAIKNVSVNYSLNEGTFIPGYKFQPHFLGLKWDEMAPTLPFVFGSQNDIRMRAASRGWLTVDSTLNTMYNQNKSTNLTVRSTVEPFKQFRVELTANKTTSNNLPFSIRIPPEHEETPT